MNLQIYQAYYDDEQKKHFDVAFIPFDNTVNETPHLREYPMWKKLYEKHKGTDAHWGLMSWRWHDKTKLAGYQFKKWIESTPGYDCYHVDPFKHLKNEYKNLWVQGNQWHGGMLEYANQLFPKLGITVRAEDLQYAPEDFGTCNYYVANSKYWESLLNFMDKCLELSKEESMHDYLYVKGQNYNGHFVPNFPFVTERLFSLHNYLNKQFKVKCYD